MTPQAIFIEAGHGKTRRFSWAPEKNDPGAISKGGITERELTVRIARGVLAKVQKKARLMGWPIIEGVGILTSATKQAKIAYMKKVIRENRLNPAQCFGLSIHINSATPTAKGFEIFFSSSYPQTSFLCSRSVYDAVAKYDLFDMRRGGPVLSTQSSHGKLYIDDVGCPFGLAEVGFLSNNADLETLVSETDRVAEAIAHGIVRKFRTS